jgi:hypothetical protein
LISRYFPSECFNSDLPRFAAAMKETPALAEALFYLTCRTEKLVAQVADEVVFPSLPLGGVSRTKIRDYVQSQFPESKSAKQATNACVETYTNFGIGSATRTRLNVSLREGSLASFAYVLHLEFPEPGMYAFERMVDGPMHTWLQRYERVDFPEARSPTGRRLPDPVNVNHQLLQRVPDEELKRMVQTEASRTESVKDPFVQRTGRPGRRESGDRRAAGPEEPGNPVRLRLGVELPPHPRDQPEAHPGTAAGRAVW